MGIGISISIFCFQKLRGSGHLFCCNLLSVLEIEIGNEIEKKNCCFYLWISALPSLLLHSIIIKRSLSNGFQSMSLDIPSYFERFIEVKYDFFHQWSWFNKWIGWHDNYILRRPILTAEPFCKHSYCSKKRAALVRAYQEECSMNE